MSILQDTGKFRQNTKDQYYTKAAVAEFCINHIQSIIKNANTYKWVEPSAGNGVFLKALPPTYDKIGIDIDPQSENIEQCNFLDWSPPPPTTQTHKLILFGNPPFGRQSSLAKAFIKHAAKYATVIAFILPRSFVKPSMSNAFPLQFHCSFCVELDKNSFEVNGKSYDVPCVFQIWEKKETNRLVEQKIPEIGFIYVKPDTQFHIAFKRVGGLAGKCYGWSPTATADFHKEYHYFIQLEPQYLLYVNDIIEKINLHTFPSNTVGPRSLSKSEANHVINQVLASFV
jgi:hypothetical protein